jgi:hypothetical protein
VSGLSARQVLSRRLIAECRRVSLAARERRGARGVAARAGGRRIACYWDTSGNDAQPGNVDQRSTENRDRSTDGEDQIK